MGIKSAVNRLFRREPGRGLFSGAWGSGSGIAVTEDGAMRLAAVNACVRVLSEDVAALPLRIYERTADGKHRATEHPLYNILTISPNPEMTAISFKQALMVNLLLTGDAYAYIEYEKSGRIKALWPLISSEVDQKRDTASGDIRYIVQGETIRGDYIMHVPGMSYDGLKGLSPIGYARESIGTDMAAEKYGAKFFKNGVHLTGVVSSDKPIADTAYDRTVARFREMFSGLEKAHGVAFLEDGAKYTPIGVSAKDAQFIETRKFQREEIAAIFRVPPHLIGDLEHATFSNIEHQSIEYLQRGLLPWLKRLEQAAMCSLIAPHESRRYYIEHDTGDFLRGDTLSRMQAYTAAIQAGILTPNEARGKENQNPLPGLDVAILPLNMAMVDIKTGKIITPQGSSANESQSSAKVPRNSDNVTPNSETGKGSRSDFLTDVLRRDVGEGSKRRFEARGLFGVSNENITRLETATRAWLKAQAEGLMALIEGNARAEKKRKYTVDHLLSSINTYYKNAAEQGADALKAAVKSGEFPSWADMDAAIEGMARDAFSAVEVEIGEGASEEWIKGFLERYSANMGERLAEANRNELTRVVSEAGDEDAVNALDGMLNHWWHADKEDRASAMAHNEVALCVNEAKTAAYRHAGYTSRWASGGNCCEVCQRLNGQLIYTLKPPLHLGCVCYVTIGDKVKPEWLTKGFTVDKISTEDDALQWVNTIGKNLGIRKGEQDKHREGTNEYKQYQEKLGMKNEYGPAILSISDSEVAALVAKYAGTGKRDVKYGIWDGTEEITVNELIIGMCVNNRTGKRVPTSTFKIHYGNKGFHIVPDYPSKRRNKNGSI